MTTYPGSPRLLKGGLVLLDTVTSAMQVINLQYNPDTLSRTLQMQGAGNESGDRLEALRLKGPPIELIKLEAEIDAADQLALPSQNQQTVTLGIHPQLSLLEMIVYPKSADLLEANAKASQGIIDIAPPLAPLTIFVWGKNRVVPVRVSDFSITEEAFDPHLNPIRARVSLGLRVLSVSDLGFTSKGASLYLAYQQMKESLASKATPGTLGALGLSSI